MKFYLYNNKEKYTRRPNKLKYIIIWLTLIIVINIIFYYLGIFDKKIEKRVKICETIKKVKPVKQIITKNNSFRNNINYDKINKNIFEIVPKENIEAIESILQEVKNIPVPQTNNNDYYNFLNNI